MSQQTVIYITHAKAQASNLRKVLYAVKQFLLNQKAISGVCSHTNEAYFDPKFEMRFKDDHVLGRLEFYAPFHKGDTTFPECQDIKSVRYSQRGLNVYQGEYHFDGDDSNPVLLKNSDSFITLALHRDEMSLALLEKMSQFLADQLEDYAVFLVEDDCRKVFQRIY